MKKIVLLLASVILLVSACKKNKSTGHLWVQVNLSHPLSTLNVPDSLKTIAGGSLVQADSFAPGLQYVLNTASDNSSNRSSKTLDFGELNPGKYQVDSIHAYAYGDSVYTILGAQDTTPKFTITANHDQTLTVTF